MKQFQLLFFTFLLLSTSIFAQSNDECANLIPLGTAPICQTDIVYSNIGASGSDIGVDNSPSCFNGGTTQRDVWFSFVTTADFSNYTFSVRGVTNGPNNQTIRNPQIALYRGTCNGGLAELFCATALNGMNEIELDVLDLSAGVTYILRVNDYSATGAPNAGDFNLCVEELSSEFNIGEEAGSVVCAGTLYDSGGAEGDYGNVENETFTICPQDFHECIEIDVLSYAMENGFDFLNFYAGEGVSGQLIASLTGTSSNNDFKIQIVEECVTIEFRSDALITREGFELSWQCTTAACDGSTFDNPTIVNSLPFQDNGASTCGAAATFANTPCNAEAFINGPEVIYVFESPGNLCTSISVSGAAEGTGVLVLDGNPNDPNTSCVSRSATGIISSVNMETAGTYYIVVANGSGCTDYNIAIEETECPLSPALVDALCNPLNGCVEDGGIPSQFIFEDGFQDVNILPAANSGCWIGVGLEPDFYWFTIQANADGDFGFIVESSDVPSDIDFNVWGPFDQETVCNDPDAIVDFVSFNQPIRSSYSPDPVPTGLTNVNPVTGEPVTDEFDCGSLFTPGAGGDNFVRTIQAQEGEIYAVLINDWGNEIQSGGVSVDFSPSTQAVLDPIPPTIIAGDAAVCQGEAAQIEIESSVGTIRWLDNTETLSCNDCFNPLATPTESTVYTAVIDGVCTLDTIMITVQVYEVDAGEDHEVCRGEEIQIEATENYPDATITWIAPDGIELSCTDCPAPIVSTPNAGTFTLTVNLDAPDCPATDEVTITVRQEEAPIYDIKDDLEVCIGQSTDLMNNAPNNQSYEWTSEPAGFTSSESNPIVMPNTTTRYYVAINNGICPIPSMDSVLVNVSQPPLLNVSEDIEICQGETIVLGNTMIQPNVEYMWVGAPDIEDPTDPNSSATPTSSGDYVLTATRGGCEVSAQFNVSVIPIGLDLLVADTFLLCFGDTLGIGSEIIPTDNPVIFTPNNNSVEQVANGIINVFPSDNTTYYASTESNGCIVMDSVFVRVDSLPFDLMIAPADTTICEGQIVELVSPTYEPSDFPFIDFMWSPNEGMQSPDSLFNLVVNPTDSVIYQRVSISGGCVDTTKAVVNVNPVTEIQVFPENPEICVGESVGLTAIGEEIETYMWMPMTGLSCTECPNPTASPGQTTTYMVMGQTDSGCPAMGQITVTVSPAPTYAFPAQNLICSGDEVTLNLAPNNNFIYSWSASDGSLNSNEAAPIVNPTQTTTYTLTIQRGDCDPITDQITIEVAPDANLEPIDNQIACQGERFSLMATGTGRITFEDPFGNFIDGPTLFPDTELLGTNTYIVRTVTGPNCDFDSTAFNVTVVPSFQIDSLTQSIQNPVAQGSNVDLQVFVSGLTSDATYTWTANGQPLNVTGPLVTVTPLDETQYEVTITSAEGCSQVARITITVVEPEFEVPNIFTPNDDGVNDLFNVVNTKGDGLGLTEVQDFIVYNRWGQTVYSNETPDEGWNGEFNEKNAPSDVYAYYIVLIKPDGTEQVFKGDVTLLR